MLVEGVPPIPPIRKPMVFGSAPLELICANTLTLSLESDETESYADSADDR